MSTPAHTSVHQLRLRKAWFALTHPVCWPALARSTAPSIEHRAVLREIDADLLLDVGANRGQFSLMMRLLHPDVPIHAYEPLTGEAGVYRELFGRRRDVELHLVALGSEAGEGEMHVSGRADSSSMLPIGALQSQLFPSTSEVGTRKVPVATLDSLSAHWQHASRALLKIDVQGFELQVLRGAGRALEHCAYVYVECSSVSLYDNQALFPEVAAFLESRGFTQARRANEQWSDTGLVQADYLFVRKPSAGTGAHGGQTQ